MSATDELRRMLDERGVEWMPVAWNPKRETFYCAENGVGFCADEYADGLMIHTDDTFSPEQAIAATIGKPTFNANLEQALSFMRIWISDDAHLGESELSAAFEKAEGLRKLDSIESAIAATLCHSLNNPSMSETLSERGTCKNLANHQGRTEFVCSECGTHYLGFRFKYCPNCGAKVVDE